MKDLSAPTIRRSVALHLAVLLGYIGIGIWLTWPLLPNFSSGVPCWNEDYFADASQNVWNMWWVRQAMLQGANPFWTPLLYYPMGVQLYVQTLNLPSALIALPIQTVAGPVGAYNSAALLSFVLTGYTVFLLLRAFVSSAAVAFFCGALVMASPFHMMKFQVCQLNLMSIQWLPLYLLALLRLDQTQRRRYIWAAVGLFVLIALTDWYWMLICAIFAAAWFLTGLLGSQRRCERLRGYALFGVGAVLLLSPILIGIAQVRQQLPAHDQAIWASYVRGYSADALGLLFPSVFHPIWGVAALARLSATVPGTFAAEGWYIAAGWVLLGCAALGLRWGWRQHRRLLLAGGLLWVLSLGPELRVLGVETGIPLPYALLQQLPLLNSGRRPSHFAALLVVVAAIFAGLGLERIARGRSAWRVPVLLLLALLATVELWPPRRDVLALPAPAFLEQLRSRPGAVADLPLERLESSRSLRNQMVHGQPIVGGYVARRPPYHHRYSPLWNQLTWLRRRDSIVPDTADDLRAMQCFAPIRHIIVRRPELKQGQHARLLELLTALTGAPPAPQFQDQGYLWYELPSLSGECRPFIYVGAGWHELEEDGARRWRWSGPESEIWIVNPQRQALTATVLMHAEPFAEARAAELWHAETLLARWTVTPGRRLYRIPLVLPPGAQRLVLRVETDYDEGSRRELGLAATEIRLERHDAGQ